MPDPDISIIFYNPYAQEIFDQWIETSTGYTELYKCSKCFGMEEMYKYNLGMCPEELCGLLNCRPEHKNGIQAYLAADATPEQGGIAFFPRTGIKVGFYYQPDFYELGLEINRAKPTEFEMINLLFALFIFKQEILHHRTVRIIVDNNYLRRRGQMQRHALTEAIAAILEWCDNFGCRINELFLSNEPADNEFLKTADRLSRNKAITERLTEIPVSRKNLINRRLVSMINGILQGKFFFRPESSWSLGRICGRLERMTSSFEAEPETEYRQRHQSIQYVSRRPNYIQYTPPMYIQYTHDVVKPKESNWFWTKVILFCLAVALCAHTFSARK